MSNNVEKWTLEDGRRAERRVVETALADGQQEKTIELHVEDERPLRLQQRVVERSRPIIYERAIETVDPMTGKVIEKKVEALEPKVQMHLVEHIACEKENCCKEKAAVSVNDIVEEVMSRLVPVPNAVSNEQFQQKLNSLGLMEEIGSRVKSQELSWIDKVLLGVIFLQVVGLVYILFFM